MSTFLENARKKIKQYDVISFDIFDTLLLRPYAQPTDLFKHIEQFSGMSGFCQERIDAEHRVRNSYQIGEEITFDEIYGEINPKFKKCKKLELEMEYQTLRRNEEIFLLYQEALKNKKKIIIISNMYLPEDFISKVLHKNGYKNYTKLFVSSKERLSKNTSNLFRFALNDVKVPASKVLHIGDNRHDDYDMAKLAGIDSLLYTKVLEQFFNAPDNKYALNFYNFHKNKYEAGIIVMLCAWQWLRSSLAPSKDYWYDLGFYIAGTPIYGYVNYIINNSSKIDELIFVARDGYTLQKVYNLLAPKAKPNFYIYAPRILGINCLLSNMESDDYLDALINVWKRKNKQFASELPQKFENLQQKQEWFKSHYYLLQPMASKNISKYREYLTSCNINPTKKLALVDTVTGAFSAQGFLEKIFNKKLEAFYWNVNMNYKEHTQYSYKKYAQTNVLDNYWDILEILITAPEYPIKDVCNGKPVYNTKIISKEKNFRKKLYPKISEGAIAFSKILNDIFGNKDVILSHEIAMDWVSSFCEHLSARDCKYLSCIYQSYDAENKNYFPLTKGKLERNHKKFDVNKSVEVFKIKFFKFISLLKFYVGADFKKIELFPSLTLLRIKTKGNKKKFYILGLPILTIKQNANVKKIHLLKYIPLLTISHKKRNER